MILPAVLETDPKKQIQRMEELGKYSSIIHTDIMDGKFVSGKNLNVLKILSGVVEARRGTPLLELHLMVKEPAKLFSDISKIKNVKRIILQIESDWEPALVKYKKYYQVGISLKPETPISVIPDLIGNPNNKTKKKRPVGFSFGFLDSLPVRQAGRFHGNDKGGESIDFIQLLSVTPGVQGNPFKPNVYKRALEVKKIFPKTPIEIDGAMNPARIKKLKKLGAKDFVVGSFLKGKDIEKRVRILKNLSFPT